MTDWKLPFRRYTGDELFILDEEKKEPIVEGILMHNDYTLLVAKEKVGKSILALQLGCSISSGHPFLDTFAVSKPQRVWYFATEGKDEDTKERIINMSKKVPIDKDKFLLICSAGFRFNSTSGEKYVRYLLTEYKEVLPRVIIVDALYMAIEGSLKDDEAVNSFNYSLRRFAEVCDAAVVIVHHSRRPVILDGKIASMGDDDIYGSAFLKASVDHCFYMALIQGGTNRSLKCSTQRSGNIVEDMTLELHEPSPLYFSIADTYYEHREGIKQLLERTPGGLTIKGLMKKSTHSRATIYRILNSFEDGVIKTQTRPVIYLLKNAGGAASGCV